MKITDSTIIMNSSRSYVEKYEKTESLKKWVGNVRPIFPDEVDDGGARIGGDSLEISGQAKKLQECNCTGIVKSDDEDLVDAEDKVKIQLIENFIELFTGKKIKIHIPKLNTRDDFKANTQIEIGVKESSEQPKSNGWGLEYEFHESKFQSEKTTFNSHGVIKTADGKEIKFQIDLSMSHEFMQKTDISLRYGDAKQIDPLVINFDGNSSDLTEKKYSFDLDVDGIEDQISFVSENSGFLAIDKNADGIINNGSELFGPSKGDGFLELSDYDEDKNGWIDENDQIFDKLRIWTKDEKGETQIFAIGQKGIGAIYLGNISTDFELNNKDNEQNGQIKSTGIYVNENGSVGTIQHIDLVL